MKFPSCPLVRTLRGCLWAAAMGFSLIELLVVVAILGLLAAFAIPALTSLTAARSVTQAAYDVSAILEQARDEAVSRATYVWVGLQPTNTGAGLDLRIGLVYSKDGTTNTAVTNLQPLSRAILVKRVGITEVGGLDSRVREDIGQSFPGTSIAETATNSGVDFAIGGVGFGDRRTITFTPRGEAMLAPRPGPATGFDPLIGIGLRQTRGTNMATGNDAAVVLDGSIGVPVMFQLH